MEVYKLLSLKSPWRTLLYCIGSLGPVKLTRSGSHWRAVTVLVVTLAQFLSASEHFRMMCLTLILCVLLSVTVVNLSIFYTSAVTVTLSWLKCYGPFSCLPLSSTYTQGWSVPCVHSLYLLTNWKGIWQAALPSHEWDTTVSPAPPLTLSHITINHIDIAPPGCAKGKLIIGTHTLCEQAWIKLDLLSPSNS